MAELKYDQTSHELMYKGTRVEMAQFATSAHPWFREKTVAKLLGYANATQALAKVPQSHRLSLARLVKANGPPLYTRSTLDYHELKSTYIDEAGLYILTLNCSKPQAQQFVLWIAETVLPQVRRDGTFDVMDQVTQVLEDETEKTEGVLYAVTSPLVNVVKIGYWTGELERLWSRYHTYFGKPLQVVVSRPLANCVKAEASLKTAFMATCVWGELFDKNSFSPIADYISTL